MFEWRVGVLEWSFFLFLWSSVQWVVIGTRETNDIAVVEQDRSLVVTAKEDPASLFAHCVREKITNIATTSLHLLNRCCSMPNGSLHQLNCVLMFLCMPRVCSAFMSMCVTVCLCCCMCHFAECVCVGMYYELVCCIDEDIWCFHMRVSWFVKSQFCHC